MYKSNLMEFYEDITTTDNIDNLLILIANEHTDLVNLKFNNLKIKNPEQKYYYSYNGETSISKLRDEFSKLKFKEKIKRSVFKSEGDYLLGIRQIRKNMSLMKFGVDFGERFTFLLESSAQYEFREREKLIIKEITRLINYMFLFHYEKELLNKEANKKILSGLFLYIEDIFDKSQIIKTKKSIMVDKTIRVILSLYMNIISYPKLDLLRLDLYHEFIKILCILSRDLKENRIIDLDEILIYGIGDFENANEEVKKDIEDLLNISSNILNIDLLENADYSFISYQLIEFNDLEDIVFNPYEKDDIFISEFFKKPVSVFKSILFNFMKEYLFNLKYDLFNGLDDFEYNINSNILFDIKEIDSALKEKEKIIQNLKKTIKRKQVIIKEKNIKIKELRSKIRTENKPLLSEIHDKDMKIDEMKKKILEYKKKERELNTLRNFAYSITHDDEFSQNNIDYINKLSVLSKRIEVVIIGGPDNWRNKINQELPFIETYSGNSNITVASISKFKYVFIYTKYISHSLYHKVVDNLEDNQCLGYVNNTNLELVSKQIIEFLNEH